MRSPSKHLLPVCCVLLFSSCFLSAATDKGNPVGQNTSPAAVQVSPGEPALKVTLKASREQALAGSFFGITAILENPSDKPVYVTGNSVALTLPPEIDTQGPRNWPAFFPGIDVGISTSDANYWDKYNNHVVVLPAKSKMCAMWAQNLGRNSPGITGWVEWFFNGLIFPPGKYTFTVAAGYWDAQEAADKKLLTNWHTQSADMLETIGAPQSTIVFGAILGGIFAFWLVWRVDPALYSGWGKGIWLGMFSSALLGVIITILMARLSETDFIIRTTVNDLWGAMAVGFIASASGPTILQKFTNALKGGRQSPKPEEPKLDGTGEKPSAKATVQPVTPVFAHNGHEG